MDHCGGFDECWNPLPGAKQKIDLASLPKLKKIKKPEEPKAEPKPPPALAPPHSYADVYGPQLTPVPDFISMPTFPPSDAVATQGPWSGRAGRGEGGADWIVVGVTGPSG